MPIHLSQTLTLYSSYRVRAWYLVLSRCILLCYTAVQWTLGYLTYSTTKEESATYKNYNFILIVLLPCSKN
jgi:hypothetical protein